MTTTMSSSAALAVIEPAFSEAEKLALAGFLAGYCGLTRQAYALDLRLFTAWCRPRQLRLFAVRRADIELFARDLETAGRGPGDRHPAAVHHRRPVQVRGRGRPARPLPGRARPPSPARLPIPCHRPGPQPSRRTPRRRARRRRRARPGLAARPQRPAGLRGHRRRHRSARHRARPPDPGHHPQGRQESRHPARAAHRPRDRPGRRRTLRRTHLRDRRRGTAGPARSRADSPPGRPPRRPGQENRPAHPAPRTHHSRPRRRRPAEGRAGSRLPRRPAHHHAPKRARVSLDRHATYIVSAYIAGAAR